MPAHDVVRPLAALDPVEDGLGVRVVAGWWQVGVDVLLRRVACGALGGAVGRDHVVPVVPDVGLDHDVVVERHAGEHGAFGRGAQVEATTTLGVVGHDAKVLHGLALRGRRGHRRGLRRGGVPGIRGGPGIGRSASGLVALEQRGHGLVPGQRLQLQDRRGGVLVDGAPGRVLPDRRRGRSRRGLRRVDGMRHGLDTMPVCPASQRARPAVQSGRPGSRRARSRQPRLRAIRWLADVADASNASFVWIFEDGTSGPRRRRGSASRPRGPGSARSLTGLDEGRGSLLSRPKQVAELLPHEFSHRVAGEAIDERRSRQGRHAAGGACGRTRGAPRRRPRSQASRTTKAAAMSSPPSCGMPTTATSAMAGCSRSIRSTSPG